MTAPENFAARWSRLKRGSATDRKTAPAENTPPDTLEPATFDPATLPPIESIMSDTDIRAFLQWGVPAGLAQAALRRAWASDPAIRDFIGIAENQWNFTDPNGVPGFGPMRETDDLASLVAQALGTAARGSDAVLAEEATEVVSAEEAPQTPDHGRGAVDARSHQSPDMLVAGSVPKSDAADAAEQAGSERPPSHGSALPR